MAAHSLTSVPTSSLQRSEIPIPPRGQRLKVRPNNPELTDSFADYLRIEKGRASLTVEAYRCDLTQFGIFLGKRLFVAVQVQDIRDYVAHLLAVTKSSSVTRKVSTLRNFFRFLLADGHIVSNPMLRVETPKTWTRVRDSLSGEEVQAVIDYPRSQEAYRKRTIVDEILRARDQAIIELLYASGIRDSELADARLADLNLDGGYLKVTGKGSKERIAPIGRPAREALQHYLNQRHLLTQPKLQREHDAWYLWVWQNAARQRIQVAPTTVVDRRTAAKRAAQVLKGINWDDSPWLFVSERLKEKLTRQRIWQIVRARSSAVGRNIYPHLLRHTCATQMVKNGAGLRTVQEILGHVDINTTQIYTHVDEEGMRKALARHPRNSGKYKQMTLQLPSAEATIRPAPIRPGFIICAQCSRPVDLAKGNWLCDVHLRLSREAAKRYTDRHRAAGLCAHCQQPCKTGKTCCEVHARAQREASRRCYRASHAPAPVAKKPAQTQGSAANMRKGA